GTSCSKASAPGAAASESASRAEPTPRLRLPFFLPSTWPGQHRNRTGLRWRITIVREWVLQALVHRQLSVACYGYLTRRLRLMPCVTRSGRSRARNHVFRRRASRLFRDAAIQNRMTRVRAAWAAPTGDCARTNGRVAVCGGAPRSGVGAALLADGAAGTGQLLGERSADERLHADIVTHAELFETSGDSPRNARRELYELFLAVGRDFHGFLYPA